MNKILVRTGKTKQIFACPPQLVSVFLTDHVTAGDGESKIEVLGKGALSKEIAVNCFRLLISQGIPTSFIADGGPNSFTARYTTMAPVEVVVRGIATGSYLERNPDVPEGHVFEKPVVEFFFKDDAAHDPLMKRSGGGISLYKARRPVSDESLLEKFDFEGNFFRGDCWELWGEPMNTRQIDTLYARSKKLVTDAYSVLSAEWRVLGFSLIDLKIEVGVCPFTGEVLISDAITPDEWR
ncbi:MAG: phosphoribosylaminoimidazolesuccinocarboxamide synthase, partial [bacterium]